MVSAGWGGAMKRNTSRGRRGWGTARHFRSAEREVVGGLNVLYRGEYVCAMLLTYISMLRIYLLPRLEITSPK